MKDLIVEGDEILQPFGLQNDSFRTPCWTGMKSLRFKNNFNKIIALGGHLKGGVAYTEENRLFLEDNFGSLDDLKNYTKYKSLINQLSYHPEAVAIDLHPLYLSSSFAEENFSCRKIRVQHHQAHIVSCLADNNLWPDSRVLGISFDGTGLGEDGHLWGGEFLIVKGPDYQRVAHFDYFALPGGERAILQPWRVAFSILEKERISFPWEVKKEKMVLVKEMLAKGLNCPLSSSMGRIFDAVSALLGIRTEVSYEGEAAVELEKVAEVSEKAFYDFEIQDGTSQLIKLKTFFSAMVMDIEQKVSSGRISAKFHNSVANLIFKIASKYRKDEGIKSLVFSGGVFQNKFLVERIKEFNPGFKLYFHQRLSTTDSSISVGQALVANEVLNNDKRDI